jgi:hypothetical protein
MRDTNKASTEEGGKVKKQLSNVEGLQPDKQVLEYNRHTTSRPSSAPPPCESPIPASFRGKQDLEALAGASAHLIDPTGRGSPPKHQRTSFWKKTGRERRGKKKRDATCHKRGRYKVLRGEWK